MKRFFLLILVFFSAFTYTEAQEKGADLLKVDPLKQLTFQNNIVYKTVKGENIEMILFMPKVKKYAKTPVMIFTHGGGGWQGDRYIIGKSAFAGTLKMLNDNGIACASVEYRLVREGISTRSDCVVDCKDAGRFLKKNAAKFGLDPDKMGIWGGSAGGHLALMTVLAPDDKFPGDPALKGFEPDYKVISAYFPSTSFESPERVARLGEGAEIAKLLSPINYISKTGPPTLILHGDADIAVPIAQSIAFMAEAKKVGANVEMLTVKGAGHTFKGDNIQPSMPEINRISAEFIMKHLLK